MKNGAFDSNGSGRIPNARIQTPLQSEKGHLRRSVNICVRAGPRIGDPMFLLWIESFGILYGVVAAVEKVV